MEERRVVVTGMGMIASVGIGVDACWEALLAGRSGLGPITRFDVSEYRSRIAGEVKDFDPTQWIPPKEVKRLDPFCHFGVAAGEMALADCGIDLDQSDRDRCGVIIGSGIGGIQTMQEQILRLKDGGPGKVSPFLVPMQITDMASGSLSIRHGLRGPNFGVVSACASATHAIGEAWWAVKRNDAEMMVAGGAEAATCAIGLAGFCSMKALSTRNDDPVHASRPFDADRDGFVMSEGAGVVILEELEHAKARGARILGELIGYGASADAYHITAPAPGGEGAAMAIRAALKHARIAPTELDYINAHGTSTPFNDKFETMAIKTVLGDYAYRLPVSSTKSLTGHAMGAAGGLEAIICLKAINEGVVPGTWNYETPDPDCDLDYVPNQTREVAVTTALSSNFGFGGHNGVLIFRRFAG